MDVFSECADACFADAWLPGYRHEPKGTSLIVIRNSELGELFLQGLLEGELQLDEITPEEIVLSQRGHVRRKRELIYMRSGVQEPTNLSRVTPTMTERINWWLGKRTQGRSKSAWAGYGRKYGRFVFWLVLVDVLFLQYVIHYATKVISIPKRLIGKL